MHAVSVGEVNVCTQLIRALEPRLPNLKIVVSTTTTTGMGELQKKLPTHISKIYYPMDRRSCVTRAFCTIHPEAIVLVEAEIWPNFIWRARDMGIPLFLVNARLSERSFRRYRRFGFLFRQLFAAFTGRRRAKRGGCGQAARTGLPARGHPRGGQPEVRRRQTGGEAAARCAGDAAPVGRAAERADPGGGQHARRRGGDPGGACSAGCASGFPDLFLVLVPRHFERSREVGRRTGTPGLKFVYRNEVTASAQFPAGEVDCLLVNTTGELRYFYEHATVIFVGKSLTAEGGQNPIEPGALGKPMVFGPNMQNFAEIARSVPGAGRGGAGAGCRRAGDRPGGAAARRRPARANWGATRWRWCAKTSAPWSAPWR